VEAAEGRNSPTLAGSGGVSGLGFWVWGVWSRGSSRVFRVRWQSTNLGRYREIDDEERINLAEGDDVGGVAHEAHRVDALTCRGCTQKLVSLALTIVSLALTIVSLALISTCPFSLS